ncbi:MAG: ROK family transcriptional regulator [Bacilli bacterium]|nr:ROK family transcriptional regulator [Bacilli bacterium]
MTSFDNQYNFRVDNQLKLLFELRNGPTSLNDLAVKLGISLTAITKIVDQLVNENVITFTQKQKSNKKGRKPTFVKINNKVGVTCAIDLSNDEPVVVLTDLRNRIILQRNIETSYFLDEVSLELIVKIIEEMLDDPVIEGRKLLSICIAVPGLVNKNTGEITNSFRLNKLGNISLSTFFFNKLGAITNIYSDVKIGLVGERMFGAIPSNAKNYMFLHIGNGCSFSFTFNGTLYQGSNGYCGELSSYKDNDWFNPSYTNNHLEDLSNVAARAEKINPKLQLTNEKFRVNFTKLIQLVEQKDPTLISCLNDNAKMNAVQLIAYNDILDLEYIVLSGTILKIGNSYKDLLLKYIKELNTVPFRAKIIVSSVDNPILYGTIYQANNLYFLRKLEQIINKKAPSENYDISVAFGNNI